MIVRFGDRSGPMMGIRGQKQRVGADRSTSCRPVRESVRTARNPSRKPSPFGSLKMSKTIQIEAESAQEQCKGEFLRRRVNSSRHDAKTESHSMVRKLCVGSGKGRVGNLHTIHSIPITSDYKMCLCEARHFCRETPVKRVRLACQLAVTKRLKRIPVPGATDARLAPAASRWPR